MQKIEDDGFLNILAGMEIQDNRNGKYIRNDGDITKDENDTNNSETSNNQFLKLINRVDKPVDNSSVETKSEEKEDNNLEKEKGTGVIKLNLQNMKEDLTTSKTVKRIELHTTTVGPDIRFSYQESPNMEIDFYLPKRELREIIGTLYID